MTTHAATIELAPQRDPAWLVALIPAAALAALLWVASLVTWTDVPATRASATNIQQAAPAEVAPVDPLRTVLEGDRREAAPANFP